MSIRPNVHSGKCPFWKIGFRGNVHSAKCFLGKCPFWKVFFGEIHSIRCEHIFTKCKSTVLDELKFLFKKIRAQINLLSGTNDLKVLQQGVQQNCYFAHPENLLFARLGDENKTVTAKTINTLQKIRYTEEGSQEKERDPVREFDLAQV